MIWQPIETAPKDGTEILSAVKGTNQVLIVRWEGIGSADRGEWFYDNDGYTWPTHWMPLPEPPK
jgi:hypothetical protein